MQSVTGARSRTLKAQTNVQKRILMSGRSTARVT